MRILHERANDWVSLTRTPSQLKPRPLLLHPALPLPLLPATPLYPLINPPQLECEPWPELLQPGPYLLRAFHFLPVRSDDALLRFPPVTEDVAVSAHEDVVALVVQCHYLPPLQLGLGGE